ncbi:MAG: phosphoribosylglycinamide formyltransferase [Candidatus Krumholzibacteria bacterium]|nr:phosphoribosylglycinamide formyltransferase [Candidatus Krumholzibacteria bacterium]
MKKKSCNIAVMASGTGTNFVAIAEACHRGDIAARVVCLISDRPQAPALQRARSLGIATHLIELPSKPGLPSDAEQELVMFCRSREVDLIALAGFMRILKGPLLTEFEGRIMNIHPSLLPSFKGLRGIGQALDYGVKVTGCSVHFVDRSVDGGAIITQAAVPIAEDDTEDTLAEKIHKEEHRIYVQAIGLFAQGRLRREGRRTRILSASDDR